MKVAFVTPELSNLVRRTNLASVAESLSQALARQGADVRIFLPRTVDVRVEALSDLSTIASVDVPSEHGPVTFRIQRATHGELSVYLFENEALFGSRHPYGGDEGPYADNWRRYSLFARAVLASVEPLSFSADIFHCLDWTTGMIPLYHRLLYADPKADHPATKAGTYFAIHNLAMQGIFEREVLPKMDVPHRLFRYVDGLELGGKVNFLKAGAEFATVIGTHSPAHAEKIQEQDRGYGLEETFQRRKKELVGITNGIDYSTWDPSSDPILPANFSASDKDPSGKRKCKAHLQALLKLDSGPRQPIAITIGRWDADSGFDLLAEILTPVLERGIQLIVMGSGQPDIQQRLKTMEGTFMGRCRVVEGYDPRTAHLMMAGADFLFLPSHYNPSNSMFAVAMRYGASPVVYAKSGLEDAVVDANANAKAGTGFHFEPYTSDGLMDGIESALKAYKNATNWKPLVKRCLKQDFSWDATGAEYLKAYRRVTRRTRARKAS